MGESGVQGSCLCGAVRFSVRLPSLSCGHCHCSICRRNHGAGYVTWLVVSRDRFSLDAGDGELARYRSSDHGSRSFCARCGSSLFCESTHRPDQIDIVLANLDGPIDRQPQVHVYWDDRVDWVATDDGLPRLGGQNGMEPVVDEDGA